MVKNEFQSLLLEGMTRMELHKISEEVVVRLESYAELLMKWNDKINLTAHKSQEESLEKNFLDCLPLISFLSSSNKVLDIGSGAGFPGLMIKSVLTSLQLVLLEADRRKASFLATVIRELKLKEVEIVCEYLDHQSLSSLGFENQFDTIVSRATIPLPKILPLAEKCLIKGGFFLGMISNHDELSPSPNLSLVNEISYILPFSKIQRKILVYLKNKQN